MDELVKDGERVDDLQIGGLRIIQDPRKFCFGIDAVMLANFATVKKGDTVLDFGTGTGIIPLILAGKTEASRIIGIEIQREMAEMAARSVRMNRLEGKISIIHGDIRNIGEHVRDNSVDLVVSNPPYMDEGCGLVNPDDSKAIARHEIMCTLDDLMASAAKVLKEGGRLAMIHRSSRMVDVLSLMREKGIEPKKLRMIHSHAGKDSNLFLVEGSKSGGRFLKVLKPLVIYSQGQSYTDEIHSIYYHGERM